MAINYSAKYWENYREINGQIIIGRIIGKIIGRIMREKIIGRIIGRIIGQGLKIIGRIIGRTIWTHIDAIAWANNSTYTNDWCARGAGCCRGVNPLEPSWEIFVYVFHMRALEQNPYDFNFFFF